MAHANRFFKTSSNIFLSADKVGKVFAYIGGRHVFAGAALRGLVKGLFVFLFYFSYFLGAISVCCHFCPN